MYRDALHADAADDGTLVQVATRNGTVLGWGFWDTRSPIALRVLATGALKDQSAAEALVNERLTTALQLRLARLDRGRTNAFRWVHGEGDRLPGVHVDVYGHAVGIRFDGAGARAFYTNLSDRLIDIGRRLGLPLEMGIDREQRTLTGVAMADITVLENGHKFLVDLQHGQKGGLFLDQRENRAEVGRLAGGRRVANIFGYTGGFSVYAAAAGAQVVDTVDLAKPAIAAARENFRLNGLDEKNAGFHAMDAFAFLDAAVKRRETWDIVITDPPSFVRRKRDLESGLRAYTRLARAAARVVTPRGTLCAASCSSHVTRETFIAAVMEGLTQARRHAIVELVTGAGFDHPVLPAFPEGDYLKFVVLRLD